VAKFTKLFNASLLTEYSPEVTHLVLTSDNRACCRTMKYLSCVVNGSWVVDIAWLQGSIDQGTVLPEEDFLVRSDGVAADGPALARKDPGLLQGLFRGFWFDVLEADPLSSYSPVTAEQLEDLLVSCGGRLEREEAERKGCVRILLAKKSRGSRSGDKGCVAPQWVFDCISHRRVLGLGEYYVGRGRQE
jgi:hypothetical protein